MAILPTAEELLDVKRLKQRLEAGDAAIPACREHLSAANETLDFHFLEGVDAGRLTALRSAMMDALLALAWEHSGWRGDEPVALVAVGGYGRGELHPGSDIDLMVLLGVEDDAPFHQRLTAFIQLLWDIKLKPGSSVRTLPECRKEAADDVTVATNILESRLLLGDQRLFRQLRSDCSSDAIWPGPRFFEAKLAEQQARHRRYGVSAYKLEPNIKEGPGGLRDIQMVGWVAKRHFGAHSLYDLVSEGFLTEDEYHALDRGQRFLWRVRWGLHRLAGRPEERLGFDYQRRLASEFGYQDAGKHLAVEQFMGRYYREIMELSRLNEMLLQLFRENLLEADRAQDVVPINRRFQARNGFLEVTGPQVFDHSPSALLEIFLVLAQTDGLHGVRASTIRLIRDRLELIGDGFRADRVNTSLFMELLRQPRGITHELRRMNHYGVLAAYIPSFEGIVGQSQFDMFHAYTVDEHTLFVVRNLRRLFVPEFSHEFPGCSRIAAALPKPELLYLAGLFHDIGKGRGGDHSELGAFDALEFCTRHDLSPFDAHLVAWLVRNHLIFSSTAQHQDISDPAIINRFAVQIGDALHLDYLYLLTVADVRGTNPHMWNSWKDALFQDLYKSTQRALRRGLERPIEKRERIAEVKADTQRLLAMHRIPSTEADGFWSKLPQDYFLRFTADEIAWHTEAIVGPHHDTSGLLILVRQRTRRGGTEVFIYSTRRRSLFVAIASLLERIGLNVQDARLTTTAAGCALHSFTVLEGSGEPISSPARVDEIHAILASDLPQAIEQGLTPSKHPPPRSARVFSIPTRVSFRDQSDGTLTQMEITTADRPGLLARIGQILYDANTPIRSAKIATFGASVDDLFRISDAHGRPLTEAVREQLQAQLQQQLDTGTSADEPPP